MERYAKGLSVDVDNIMLVSGATPNWSTALADYKEVFTGEGKLIRPFRRDSACAKGTACCEGTS